MERINADIEKVTNTQKEFRCDPDGKAYVSKKGLARLCGVKHTSWGQYGFIFTKEIDGLLKLGGSQNGSKNAGSLTLSSSVGGSQNHNVLEISDIIAAQIIKYYAYRGNPTAQQTDMALSAMGLRAWIQENVGWKPAKRSLTPEEIVELCCLPVPTEWQRRFPVEYYQELERLTRISVYSHKRPMYWAKLTKELVYDYLPAGVYQQIKQCKERTGSYDKLHQFLSDDGLSFLENQQRTLLSLMKGASSLPELKRLLDNACKQRYQLLLF